MLAKSKPEGKDKTNIEEKGIRLTKNNEEVRDPIDQRHNTRQTQQNTNILTKSVGKEGNKLILIQISTHFWFPQRYFQMPHHDLSED